MCKSEEYIMNWIKRKYIFINFNSMRFDLNEYNYNQKIVREAKLRWFPFSTDSREEHVFYLSLTELRLQDSWFQYSTITQDDLEMFSLTYGFHRPMEYDYHV